MTGVVDESMAIGELSERTGVSVRALRHYEQNELLSAMRTGTGHRRFAPDAVETVRRIRLFLDAGMPLAAVAQVLTCFDDEGAHLHPCVADHLRAQLHAVEERIERLDGQRDTISRLQRLVGE